MDFERANCRPDVLSGREQQTDRQAEAAALSDEPPDPEDVAAEPADSFAADFVAVPEEELSEESLPLVASDDDLPEPLRLSVR